MTYSRFDRRCVWCGKPATRFTFRPGNAPTYQEWCAEHAPEDAQPFGQDPATGRTVHDAPPVGMDTDHGS